MELFGIAILAAGLMGAWHVTKHAVPRTMRAVGQHRGQAVTAWRADHPGAPTITRWAATLAKTLAALRWGPRFLARETSRAWREGIDAGRLRYGVPVVPLADWTDPNDTKNCPVCHGEVVVDGQICPSCLAAQEQRNQEFEAENPLPRPPGSRPSPRPRRLMAVPDPIPDLINKPIVPKEQDMTIQTVTGGEVNSPEQLVAELQSIVEESGAELEDARGDSARAAGELEDARADVARAEADAARIEKMVASLTNLKLPPEDVSAVSGLLEPAMARKAAAEQRAAAADAAAGAANSRAAAAEKTMSQAQAALTMAQHHVELQGQGAAGDFYRS